MALLSNILDLLFPRLCPICGTRLDDKEHLCYDCFLQLPRTEQAVVRGNQTEMLFADQRRLVRGAAYLFYEKDSPVQQMIHQIKYGRKPELGYYLGQQMAYEMMPAGFFEGIDLVIPVPLHPRRLRERGYNQSEWIARGVCDAADLPLDTKQHVTRVVDNPKQAMMDRHQREENVKNIFRVNHPEELYRKHILLVDDVTTTGQTLRSLMKALKPVRSCRISVLVVGKAVE